MTYNQMKESRDKLLVLWQQEMHKAFLLAAIAKENGVDADWVLKADDEVVVAKLVEREKVTRKVIFIDSGDHYYKRLFSEHDPL